MIKIIIAFVIGIIEGLVIWSLIKSFISAIFYEILFIRPFIYIRKKGFNPHRVTFNHFIKCLDSNEIAEFRKTFPKSQLHKFDTMMKRMERR